MDLAGLGSSLWFRLRSVALVYVSGLRLGQNSPLEEALLVVRISKQKQTILSRVKHRIGTLALLPLFLWPKEIMSLVHHQEVGNVLPICWERAGFKVTWPRAWRQGRVKKQGQPFRCLHCVTPTTLLPAFILHLLTPYFPSSPGTLATCRHSRCSGHL